MTNMHEKMAGKKCRCNSCGENKPLDSFVRNIQNAFGKDKKYQCIDCRVEFMYGEMMQDDSQSIPTIDEQKGIKKALTWLNRRV